jgi:hypothetical protein
MAGVIDGSAHSWKNTRSRLSGALRAPAAGMTFNNAQGTDILEFRSATCASGPP